MIANVAQVVACTEAEGPGRRFAIWFRGCPLRCPGCCNPEMLAFDNGTPTPVDELLVEIRESRDQAGIEGISLLGGEPLAHAGAAAALAKGAWELGLSVMIYSGYTLAEAQRLPDPGVADLLGYCDVLVDGPYLREQPEKHRSWVGSTNQVVHFLTDRYRADDPIWTQRNTLEIRLRDGQLTVNGFPSPSAIGLWRRPLPHLVGQDRE